MSPFTAQPTTATGAPRRSWPKGRIGAAVPCGGSARVVLTRTSADGEQGNDGIERRRCLEICTDYQELSDCKRKECADHVD